MGSAVKSLEPSMIQLSRARLQADMGVELCGLHEPPGMNDVG